MFPYWLVFFVPAVLALPGVRPNKLGWLLLGIGLTAFVGLRYQVSTDWFNYLYLYFYPIHDLSFVEALGRGGSLGYNLVIWITLQVSSEVWLAHTIIAAIFSIGVVAFCRRLPEPAIALVAIVPYGVVVFAMGYIKQATAFGFELLALSYLFRGYLLRPLVFIFCAVVFHKSAAVLLPIFLYVNRKRYSWHVAFLGAALLPIVLLFFYQAFASKAGAYIGTNIGAASDGAGVRVLMNVIPAICFLIFRKRFDVSRVEYDTWMMFSLLVLLSFPLVLSHPTLVDRLALYLTPIQLLVAAHAPRIVGIKYRYLIRYLIVIVYATVLFVWLNFAQHSVDWLPYQFWPMMVLQPG